MEGKETCKDLLDLEDKDPLSSSSALDSTLLVCKEKKKNKRKVEEAPSKPTIAPLPRSQFLDKVKGFIGVMAEANKKLEEESKENSGAFDIEALTGDETQVIEMDLMLGVADLNTPEAVKAAEAAIARNGLARSGDSSGDDESDSEDEEEKKSEEECSRKRTKIIELS